MDATLTVTASTMTYALTDAPLTPVSKISVISPNRLELRAIDGQIRTAVAYGPIVRRRDGSHGNERCAMWFFGYKDGEELPPAWVEEIIETCGLPTRPVPVRA